MGNNYEQPLTWLLIMTLGTGTADTNDGRWQKSDV